MAERHAAGVGDRVIVAMDRPDTATNVATFVPGTGSNIGNCGTEMARSDKMAQAATLAGSKSTAVVTWVGYDAPQGLEDAASGSYANKAEKTLDRFEDALRSTHEGAASHTTVLGHSYGTTVIGHTARDEGLNADDVVLVASPGVGVQHADQLHLDGVPADQTGGHIHSTVARHDIINLSNIEINTERGHQGVDPILGPDPTDPGFGGHTFTSDPGAAGPWYEGGYSTKAHSEYWTRDNAALKNMGRVIAGKPTE